MRYKRKDGDIEAWFFKGLAMFDRKFAPPWVEKFTELTPVGLRVTSGNGQVMLATLPCFIVLEKSKRGAYMMATKDFSEEYEEA